MQVSRRGLERSREFRLARGWIVPSSDTELIPFVTQGTEEAVDGPTLARAAIIVSRSGGPS
jgi:hypothetical protein